MTPLVIVAAVVLALLGVGTLTVVRLVRRSAALTMWALLGLFAFLMLGYEARGQGGRLSIADLVVTAAWTGAAAAIGMAAAKRGRSSAKWAVASFFLTPLVGLA